MVFDYHTHTTFSHGKGNIEDNVRVAIAKGLKEIAISDHGPGHLTYGIKRKSVPEMRKIISELNIKYPEIKIFLSVEANIRSEGNFLDVSQKEFQDYDFILAGYHYGITKGYCMSNWIDKKLGYPKLLGNFGKKNLIRNTEMTTNALYSNNIKVLTHPGDKGRFDIPAIARACQETNTLMEISTWHPNLTIEDIKISSRYDVRYVISSDAHSPDRVGTFRPGLARAIKAGLDLERIVNIEKIR